MIRTLNRPSFDWRRECAGDKRNRIYFARDVLNVTDLKASYDAADNFSDFV